MKKIIVLSSILLLSSSVVLADTNSQHNSSSQSVSLSNSQYGVGNTNITSVGQSNHQTNVGINHDGHYGYYGYGYHHDYDTNGQGNAQNQSLTAHNWQSGYGNLNATGVAQASSQTNAGIND